MPVDWYSVRGFHNVGILPLYLDDNKMDSYSLYDRHWHFLSIMAPCVNGNASHASDLVFYGGGEFLHNLAVITNWGILQTVLLFVVVIISVWKPWKT